MWFVVLHLWSSWTLICWMYLRCRISFSMLEKNLEKLTSWIIKTSYLFSLFTYLSSTLCQKYHILHTWQSEKPLCGLSQTHRGLPKDLIYPEIVFISCHGLIVVHLFACLFVFIFLKIVYWCPNPSIGNQALWDVLLPPWSNCCERNLSTYEGELRGFAIAEGARTQQCAKQRRIYTRTITLPAHWC